MRAAAILSLALLTGCAGLQSAWVLQVQLQYQTPDEKPQPPAAKPAAAL